MRITSLRLITDDVARLVHCYEQATGVEARWAGPEFAEARHRAPPAGVRQPRDDAARRAGRGARGCQPQRDPRASWSTTSTPSTGACRLSSRRWSLAMEPTDMPWGNRSMLVRDPDGALVNLFTPVTEAARAKFGV
ncbi:glyoxalase [Angustibacter aerolatus]|uniref:Glyoxalase n=1 Tax=Angustibacter aerolatus TaxID=1162965 RepID=A0ABQ6JIX8_9ACTN|nr:VOC family protein [Angustibacter aerolatus]GMA87511.1 glyoxalase [Angustibacter aerolatus]